MSFDMMLLTVFPIAVGTMILSEPIMRFVAGKEFAGAGKILSLLVIAVFGICLGMTFGYINPAIGRQKEALWVYITDAILSIIGYLIFIPKYGIYGAASVTIFSEFYAGIALSILAYKFSGFKPKLKNFLKITAACLFMGLAVYAVQPLNLFISIILGAIIYGALIMIFKVVSKDTMRQILHLKVVETPDI